MTNKTYFLNFFVPLCASLSDDEFLAFAEAVVANLQKDPAANADDLAFLEPQVIALRAAHTKRGVGGKSASTTTLRAAVRDFLAWAKLTNVQKVFPAFPQPPAGRGGWTFSPAAWTPSTAPTRPIS